MSELSKKYPINLNVNGMEYSVEVKPSESLNDVLRENLGLTGTKRGCDYGGCGSCTIIVNGKACYSCMYPAIRASGKTITTIEGLEQNGQLDPIQEAFVAKGGFQCAFCTPGFVMSTKALLSDNPNPTDNEIKEAIVGNICRCTGYTKILESIRYAILLQKEGPKKVQKTVTSGTIKIDFGNP